MSPYPASQAVAIAITLAALHDQPDRAPDRELLGRYRLTGELGIYVLRRWMLADRPSPTMITPDEVRRILMAEPPAAQRAIDLVGLSPHLGQIVAALLDPAARIAARTQALTGVAQLELHARLRGELGIDLDRRTIHGVAWTDAITRAGRGSGSTMGAALRRASRRSAPRASSGTWRGGRTGARRWHWRSSCWCSHPTPTKASSTTSPRR